MGKIKKLLIVAIVLILVGIAGSIFTFKPMLQQKSISEEKVINETFSRIAIVTNNTEVEIFPTTDATAKIDITGKLAKGSVYDVAANVEKSILSIDVKYEQRNFASFFPSSLSLQVYVPESVYESLQVKGDDGRIIVSDIQAKDMNIKTDNGNIDVRNVKGTTFKAQSNDGTTKLNNITATDVLVKSDNGNIELINAKASTVKTEVNDGTTNLNHVTAANAHMKSDNGKINLEKIEGQMSATAYDGGISLVTNQLESPITFKTANGDIHIQTKEKPTNATINTSVENGKVNIFGNSNSSTVFGNGEYMIHLASNDGSITVGEK